MQTDRLDVDYVIGGGGIAGSVAAVRLSQQGFRVALVEPNPRSEQRHGGEMLHPRAVACLSQLGLVSTLGDTAVIEGFNIHNDDGAGVMLRYAPLDTGTGVALDHAALHHGLFSAAASSPGVTVIPGRIVGVDETDTAVGARVVGRTGKSTVWGRLLIGADGSNSRIRSMADIGFTSRRISIISTITVSADMLTTPSCGHVFVGGGHLCLAYPIGSGLARVMIDSADCAPRTMSEIVAALPGACPDTFRDQLMVMSPAQGIRRYVTNITRVPSPWRGRVVLIGDAAGTCHPLTASGMTSGIADVILLTDELAKAPDNIAGACRRYARRSSARQRSRLVLAETVQEVFAGTAAEFSLVRCAMMRYWRSVKGNRRATALLAMEEESPARLWWAIASTLGYGAVEILRPSLSRESGMGLTRRYRAGLAALKLAMSYLGDPVRWGLVKPITLREKQL